MEMIILCGIQATGKSTFYKENFFNSHIRISLDLLNTRNKETLFIDTCLDIQQPFVVDNTNPTRNDREKYIRKAKDKNFKITGYYFQSKLADALLRNSHRSEKENIPEIGIKGTAGRLEIPNYDEGFDQLYYVSIENNRFIIKEWNHEIR